MTESQKLLNEAEAAFAAGQFVAAARDFQILVDRHPEVVELKINLGAALRGVGNVSSAEAAYRAAISQQPDNALAWYNLGNLLRDGGRGDDAMEAFRNADRAQPRTPEFLNNLGVQSYDLGNISAALEYYEKALAVRPGYPDALTNRGNALQRLCRMEDARRDLDQALALQPDNPVFLLNKCSFYAANGQHQDALEWVERAITADPNYIQAVLKRASLRIQQGDLLGGWSDYEARWQIPGWHALPSKLPMPSWQGENLAGKHLLVWNEQGFGDALMYARFLLTLANQAAKITFACETPLHRLFTLSFAGRVEIVDLSDVPSAADYHVSLMSLPHRMDIQVSDLRPSAPYLRADSSDVDQWRARLDTIAGDDDRIGLVWAGNPNQAHDYSRSTSPEMIRCLTEIPDVQAFNLLIGARGDSWVDELLIDVRSHIRDFADSAAAMCAMDRIVSVDSAPAHLAGALGRPVSILLSFDPDSRYFNETTLSPWYPTATLYRQLSPGDWAPPIASTAEAIAAKAQARSNS